MNQSSSSPKLFAAAVSEWLMVLPAAVFLAAAALRLMQPPQFEPARTSWMFFEWTITHVSRAGAGVLFLALPVIAVVGGCATLLMFCTRARRCGRMSRPVSQACAAISRSPFSEPEHCLPV